MTDRGQGADSRGMAPKRKTDRPAVRRHPKWDQHHARAATSSMHSAAAANIFHQDFAESQRVRVGGLVILTPAAGGHARENFQRPGRADETQYCPMQALLDRGDKISGAMSASRFGALRFAGMQSPPI